MFENDLPSIQEIDDLLTRYYCNCKCRVLQQVFLYRLFVINIILKEFFLALILDRFYPCFLNKFKSCRGNKKHIFVKMHILYVRMKKLAQYITPYKKKQQHKLRYLYNIVEYNKIMKKQCSPIRYTLYYTYNKLQGTKIIKKYNMVAKTNTIQLEQYDTILQQQHTIQYYTIQLRKTNTIQPNVRQLRETNIEQHNMIQLRKMNTIQYNHEKPNTIGYNIIQYKKRPQYNIIHFNTIQYRQKNQYSTIQLDVM
eukprot:TRINITY_DN94472_c0_g1_i1.p1 TRINITY_DN94472_c0_g1~~TRINITY_DN94472_c0_g1_i1.p1  ORF type:complete len:286 (-),score=-24.90 TRINITY_DN94472_c0_g1_i1:202-960(-)